MNDLMVMMGLGLRVRDESIVSDFICSGADFRQFSRRCDYDRIVNRLIESKPCTRAHDAFAVCLFLKVQCWRVFLPLQAEIAMIVFCIPSDFEGPQKPVYIENSSGMRAGGLCLVEYCPVAGLLKVFKKRPLRDRSRSSQGLGGWGLHRSGTD